MLEPSSRRTARLTPRWIAAGFVHGVLNTDNLNRDGRELRLRPLALPAAHYDPGFTAAYFDQTGLYSLRPPAGGGVLEPDSSSPAA
jgi:uncharacterized protein YdiU (UPF0061 family)